MAAMMRGVGAETGGVMLAVAGAAFTLQRLAGMHGVWRWLPLCAVYLALRDLRNPEPGRRRSTVPLLLSLWLQITAIGFLGFDFLNAWPLLIALAGLGLVIDGIVAGGRAGRVAGGGR
jgi:hypothetical protein